MADQTELGFQFRTIKAEDIPQRMPVIPVRTARIVDVPQLAVLDGQPRQLVIELDDGTTGWLATPAGFANRAPKPGDYVISWADGSIGWLPGASVDAQFDIPRPERKVEAKSGDAQREPGQPEPGPAPMFDTGTAGEARAQPEADEHAAGSAGSATQPERDPLA